MKIPLLSFLRNPTVRSIIFSCFSETYNHNSELACEFNLFGTPTYGGPKVSRQFQFHHGNFNFVHGNFNFVTAVSISPRQFQLRSRQFQFHHGNFNFVHGNFNFTTAISISPRQFQFCHGNFNFVHGNFNFNFNFTTGSPQKL